MPDHPFCQCLAMHRTFFLKTISCFRPEHAGFAPSPGMYTVSSHIAHAGMSVNWFVEGAFRPEGFALDFPAQEAAARAVTGLDAAVARFNGGYDAAIARFDRSTLAELHVPIAAGPIMGGAPRLAIVEAMADHAAHHRGALAVYARLLGLTPPMPYA